MAPETNSQRLPPFLKSVLLLAACGLTLGILLIAAALGFSAPEIACARLALSVGVIGVIYALWRSLGGFWPSLAGGFVVGLAYFGTTVYWLGSSANPNPDTFALGEFTLGAGAMWLFVPWWAVWFGLANLLVRITGSPKTAPVAFLLAFSVANLMLADIVMGIPLAPLSLVALDTPIAPLLRYIGQFGLDSLIVVFGTVIGVLLNTGRPRSAALAVGAGAALLIGTSQLQPTSSGPVAEKDGSRVYLAQPSLPHVSLMDPALAIETVHGEMLRQVRVGVESGASLIVLPENALLVDLTASEDQFADHISTLLPEGIFVLVGFGRVEISQSADGFTTQPFNSAALISSDGVLRVHDKAHLVPFGETMPALFFEMGFDVVAGPNGGLGSGDKIGSFEVADLPPFALVICYEAILSGAVSREVGDAKWLLNISAETLFRGTIGPRLLLDHIRIRAIETGLPVLRSTAHAFSGGIAPDGTSFGILAPEDQSGVLVSVPEGQMTHFRSVGYKEYHLALGALFAFLLGSHILSKRGKLPIAE